MIKLERCSVMNLENAMRGARNPLNSWARSDSAYDEAGNYVLGANDLDALELGAQGVNGIEQQVMGDRALGAAAIDAAADGSSFKRTSLNGKGTQRRGRVRFAAALTKYDKRWHGTGGHDDGLYVDTNHGTPPVRSG